MSFVRDTALLYKRSILEDVRNPVWLFVGLTTPILYLVLFTPLLKNVAPPGTEMGAVLDTFLPGILALTAFGSGTGAGFGTIFELQSGVIERLRVTPASRLALLVAPILANLSFLFGFSVIVVGIGAVLGFHVHLVGLVLMFLLLGLLLVTVSAFSISIALITKEIGSVAAVMNGINLPLLLLSGVLLPIALAPNWMKIIAHANPLYYAVEGARALARGTFDAPAVLYGFGVMVPLTALTLLWATRVYRKAVA